MRSTVFAGSTDWLCVLPSAETAAMLFWALLASGATIRETTKSELLRLQTFKWVCELIGGPMLSLPVPGSQDEVRPQQSESAVQSISDNRGRPGIWLFPAISGSLPSGVKGTEGGSGGASPSAADLAREQVEKTKVESLYTEYLDHFKQLTNRPLGILLTPEEMVAIIHYLHVADQHFMEYQVSAKLLERINLPDLSQRLKQIRDEIGVSITIYSDMYTGTAHRRSDWERMQVEAGTYARNNVLAALEFAQKSADDWISKNNEHNER
jgi:hypothetical protein